MLDYPYFVDVRGDGKNATSPITSDVPQVTDAVGVADRRRRHARTPGAR